MNYQKIENCLSFLYVDGGVIGKNPSSIGGTWAARIIFEKTIHDAAGVIKPTDFGAIIPITNNIAEMMALIMGLRRLPNDWIGVICSDSDITIGRAIHGWKWTNIPLDLYREFGYERNRLVNFEKFRFIGLSGHPTKEELKGGFSLTTGRPVSKHNVWCDTTCGMMANGFRNGANPSLEITYERTNDD